MSKTRQIRKLSLKEIDVDTLSDEQFNALASETPGMTYIANGGCVAVCFTGSISADCAIEGLRAMADLIEKGGIPAGMMNLIAHRLH
jgi:hypothetical protein